jgi:hypothetical protein
MDREQFKQLLLSTLAVAAVGATLTSDAEAASQGPDATPSVSAQDGSDGIFADEEYREIFRRFIIPGEEFGQFLEDFFEVVEPFPLPSFPELPPLPFEPFQ